MKGVSVQSFSFTSRLAPLKPLSLYHLTETSLSLPHLHHKNSLMMNSRCDVYAEKLGNMKSRWGGRVIGPMVRYVTCFLCGLLFSIFFRLFNSFKSYRRNILLEAIFRRPKSRGLVTVSNHLSLIDDPGLWCALLPWWRMRPEQMRWSLCTDDVFFIKGKLSAAVFGAGNVLPLDRTGSLEQPLFRLFQKKLDAASWTHLFAEGRIWQRWRFDQKEPKLGPFKVGVGKLIAHSKSNPIVVAMYHKGLDEVIPEKVLKDPKSRKASKPASSFPKLGKKIEIYVGKPFDFQDKLAAFDRENGPEMRRDSGAVTTELLALYASITNDVREEVLKLEAEAWGRSAQIIV